MTDNRQEVDKNLDNIKKNLEEKAHVEVKKLLSENKVTEDNLVNIMEKGAKEFTEKTGRHMTYSEIREMYG